MFTPKWISLKEAVDYIDRVQGGLRWIALEHLVQALRDQDVKARYASSLEPVAPIYWIDAARNPVHLRQSDYTEIEVCFADIRQTWPRESDSDEDQLRRANDRKVHEAITAVYDNAQSAGKKPPNLREIIAPVQANLQAMGYVSSGRQIQELAEAPQHKARRRRPGTTIRSEKLGNKA